MPPVGSTDERAYVLGMAPVYSLPKQPFALLRLLPLAPFPRFTFHSFTSFMDVSLPLFPALLAPFMMFPDGFAVGQFARYQKVACNFSDSCFKRPGLRVGPCLGSAR